MVCHIFNIHCQSPWIPQRRSKLGALPFPLPRHPSSQIQRRKENRSRMKLFIRTPKLGYRCSMIQYHRIYSYNLLTHPAGLKVIKHQLEIWLSKRALKVKAFGTSGQPKAESCMAYGASSHLFRNKFAADSTSFYDLLLYIFLHLSTLSFFSRTVDRRPKPLHAQNSFTQALEQLASCKAQLHSPPHFGPASLGK